MAFRFVHAADLHLDSPFRSVGAEGAWFERFQRSTFDAFARIVQLCLDEEVRLLLLAGDLFDSQDRSVRARLGLKRGLERLDAAGIRTFIVHGNHDPLAAEVKGLVLPASVKVFGGEWEEVIVPDANGGPLCRVQGISYAEERVTENLSRRFRRQGPEYTIGLLHANLGGARGHAGYAPCSQADLSASGLDYWALGHVHTRAEHVLPSGARAVYPGNPQGRHALEDGRRGCVLVTVDGRDTQTRFVPVESVRWHRLSVDIGERESLESLSKAAREAVRKACGPETPAHAVQLTLTGRGPLHAELAAPGAHGALEDSLREALERELPVVWLDALIDATAPDIDLEQVARGGGLVAAVLSAARSPEAILPAAYQEEELARLEESLRRLGVSATAPKAGGLIDRAALRAIELLLDQEGR